MATLCCGLGLIAACSEPPPPRSVPELLENPIILEAIMVRCSANRDETRYDAECVNARQAVSILEAREDREREEAFEAQSQRKREALRQTQQAAAEARRRAEEEARRREEAAYLAQFGELPPPDDEESTDEETGNAPAVVLPDAGDAPESATSGADETQPASDGGNAPTMVSDEPSDLNAIREELQRRNEDPDE